MANTKNSAVDMENSDHPEAMAETRDIARTEDYSSPGSGDVRPSGSPDAGEEFSFLLDFHPEELRKAILYAEIFGRPVCRRHRR